MHVAPRIKGIDVVEVLERVAVKLGFPSSIHVDNGPEFISKDVDLWAYWNKVKLDYSRPGKPTFRGRTARRSSRSTLGSRQECLNVHWFLSLEDARGKNRGLA